MHNFDFSSFLWEEDLKFDGSNFPSWHRHVRNFIMQNDLLCVIEEPLAGASIPNATAQDRDEYRKARDIAIEVQTLMSTTMEPHLRAYY
jgi:hypothetical protein